MKKEHRRNLLFAICLLVAFLLWTLAIQFIDVQAIGPEKSTVGFAEINKFVHNATGVNMSLYVITDWLGLVPLVFVLGVFLVSLFPNGYIYGLFAALGSVLAVNFAFTFPYFFDISYYLNRTHKYLQYNIYCNCLPMYHRISSQCLDLY